MERLKLIKPNTDFEKQVLEMAQEFYEDGSTPYGSSGLDKFLENYNLRLDFLEQNESEKTITNKHYVPSIQYILVRETDNTVIGFINTRLKLNESLLQHGGHIGYSIRPKERKNHYATGQLFAVLRMYKNLGVNKVLLICNKSNIGSARTIQNCGGILENEITDPEDGELIQRYWINVEEGIERGNKFFEGGEFNVEIL